MIHNFQQRQNAPPEVAGISGSVRLPWRGQQHRAAFTLIEVMLAVVIFSIVLAAMHMVFHGALQLRNRTVEGIERALPLQQTLSIIQRDLANVVLPGGTLFGPLQTTQNSSGTNTLEMLAPVGLGIPGESSPAFYTASGMIGDNTPWADVARVYYHLVPPTNATPGKDLIRSTTRNLLPLVQEEPERQTLMSGVQAITFSYYDGLQWREYWDSTAETNQLPRGIKVELQLAQGPGERVLPPAIELVVPVVLLAGTNAVPSGEEAQ